MSDICLSKRASRDFPRISSHENKLKVFSLIRMIAQCWGHHFVICYSDPLVSEESFLRKPCGARPASSHLSVQRSRGCGGRRQPTAQNTRRGCWRQAEPFKTMLLVCTSSEKSTCRRSKVTICDGSESEWLISLALLCTWFQYIFSNGTVWLKKNQQWIFVLFLVALLIYPGSFSMRCWGTDMLAVEMSALSPSARRWHLSCVAHSTKKKKKEQKIHLKNATAI